MHRGTVIYHSDTIGTPGPPICL